MQVHRKKFLLILQAVVLIFWATPAFAQRTVTIDQLTVTTQLQEDGTMTITQKLLFVQPSTLNWMVYSDASEVSLIGDGAAANQEGRRILSRGEGVRITTTQRASEWEITYETRSHLIRSDEQDQLYLQLVKESGYFINSVRATFLLPESSQGEGLTGNTYAIGGIGSSSSSLINNRTIRYSGEFLGPQAIFTINAKWPKSLFTLSPSQDFVLSLQNLEILPWIVLGFLLPFASLLVLLRLMMKQRRQERPVNIVLSSPPTELSPLIVGTLTDKKVYPKEIVALIIDLCQRGYLVIVKKKEQYYLALRKPLDQNLESWERDILESLFPLGTTRMTENEMKELTRESLFNPKVREAFSAIYESITAKGFFAENPHRTRVRYKLVALLFYFIGVFGAVWVAVSGTSPYLLLPLAGTLIATRLIIRLTPALVRYTHLGEEARTAWLAFGNFLALKKPLPLEALRGQVFEKNLSYAIALGKMVAWAKRFDASNTVITKPDWFISYEDDTTIHFVKELHAFSNAISKTLTEMRGPLVN